MSASQYLNLYLNKKDADVTLIIEDTEIPAHRSILSECSEYFKIMFSTNFIEAKSDKIELKVEEVNLKTFKLVLKYIYTGKLDMCSMPTQIDEVYKVVFCARFYMVDNFVKELLFYLVTKFSNEYSHILLLNKACEYSFEEQILNLIKEKLSDIIKSKAFEYLLPSAVEAVLKVGVNAKEQTVFEALVGWMRQNPDCSSSFPELLKHIDFYLLRKRNLDILLEPTPLVSHECIVDLLSEQQSRTTTIKTIVNQNVINSINDLRIVEGALGCRLINMTSSPTGAVIFDLKQNYLLNCLKLTNVFTECIHHTADYSYYGHYAYFRAPFIVSVSKNMRDWNPLNKSEVEHQLEVFNFKESVVRFIRIQTTVGYCVSSSVNIEAFLSTSSDMTLFDANTKYAQEIMYNYIESMKQFYQKL